MNILVFKTNVKFKKQVSTLTQPLNQLQGVIRWNFDLADRDRILRIESSSLPPVAVEKTLQMAGFHCAELTD